jgi:peptidyl-tRNA hydrolase
MPAEPSPLYLAPDERPEVEPEDILAVYLVVNGALGMSQGKVATQTFQGCLALYRVAEESLELKAALAAWEAQGWRTVARVAETQGVFDRVLADCAGVVLADEGLTEVPDGAATLFVSIPYRRGEAPKVLSHKRVPLF